MKIVPYLFILFILSSLLPSCVKIQLSQNTTFSKERELLSRELESYPISSTAPELKSTPKAQERKIIEKSLSPSNSEKDLYKEITKSKILLSAKSVSNLTKVPPQESSSETPIDFSKHDNVIWKFGAGLCMIGLLMFILSLSILFKVDRGPYGLWILGMLVGLIIVIISLPFLLIGAMIDSGSGKLEPKEDTEE